MEEKVMAINEYEVHTKSSIEFVYADSFREIPPTFPYGRMAEFMRGDKVVHTSWDVLTIKIVEGD
jgi:hypothetical protein